MLYGISEITSPAISTGTIYTGTPPFTACATAFVGSVSAMPYAILATVLDVVGATIRASYLPSKNLPALGKLRPCSLSRNISSTRTYSYIFFIVSILQIPSKQLRNLYIHTLIYSIDNQQV